MDNIRLILSLSIVFLLQSGIAQSAAIYSSDSLFNLGNKAFSIDQFDESIFHYERAKLIDPRAADINTNLQLAKEKLSTAIIEVEPFFLAKWWRGFSHLMLPGGWKIVSIIFLAAMLVFAYLLFLTDKLTNTRFVRPMLGVLFAFFLLSILAGNSRYNEIFHSPYAIVMGNEQSLYEGPDEISVRVKSITGGNKLRILDEDGEWYKVSAMDSEQGWLKKVNVKLIHF